MNRWMLIFTLVFCAALPAKAQEQPSQPKASPRRQESGPALGRLFEEPASQRKVSLNLQQVPLRQSLQLLFENVGVSFAIDPDVPDTLVTLNVKEISFTEALITLVRLGSSSDRPVTFEKTGNAYHVSVRKPETPPQARVEETWEKIPIQFLRAEDVLAHLTAAVLPRGISGVLVMPVDNSVLVRGDADAINELKNILRSTDVLQQTLALTVGVRGPGPNGRPVELKSQANTIRDHSVTINDQVRVGGQIGRLGVRLKPLLQGDGGILLDSDWDVSVPLAGGARGPVQFVKRLTTSTRVVPGQSTPTVVAQVDLSGWGGKGVLSLWVRANMLPDKPPASLPRAAK